MATTLIEFTVDETTVIDLNIGEVGKASYAKVTLSIGNDVIHTSQNLAKGQETYSWQITSAEIAQIINHLPFDSTRVDGTMKVDVAWAATGWENLFQSEVYQIQFKLDETSGVKPEISITSQPSPYPLYVQGHSCLKCEVAVKPKHNATIENAPTVTCDGKKCNYKGNENGKYLYTSPTLEYAGNSSICVTVTDSRGFKNEIEKTIYVHPYAEPVIITKASQSYRLCQRYRPDTEQDDPIYGTQCHIVADTSMRYIKGVNESLTIDFYYKEKGKTEWESATSSETQGFSHLQQTSCLLTASLDKIITDNTQEDETTGIPVGMFDSKKEYDIKITVTDSLGGSCSREEMLSCQSVSFHIREEGDGVAVGKHASANTFSSAWDMQCDGDITLAGNGNIYFYNGATWVSTISSDTIPSLKNRISDFEDEVEQTLSEYKQEFEEECVGYNSSIEDIYRTLNKLSSKIDEIENALDA